METTPVESRSIHATASVLEATLGRCGSGPSAPTTVDTLAHLRLSVETTRATVARVTGSVRKVRGSVSVSISCPHTTTPTYLRVTTGKTLSKSSDEPPSLSL